MHAPYRMAAAAATVLIMLTSCGQPSGNSAVTGADAGTAASDGSRAIEDPRDGPGDGRALDEMREHGGNRVAAGEASADARPTDEEIAAVFGAHAGAHAGHAPAVQDRQFPTGIVPTGVRIPAIGVEAAVVDLSLAGPEPEVPADFARVGWYTQTREPGEIGPAVLAGHVDSREGPAVFIDLDELQAGDEITLTDDTGQERRFTVDELGQYPKDDLPDEVFGFDEPVPQLRLITCGGSFDRASGHYRDNVVVYASLSDA